MKIFNAVVKHVEKQHHLCYKHSPTALLKSSIQVSYEFIFN